MKFNVLNKNDSSNNMHGKEVEEKLNSIKPSIEEAITLSLKEASSNNAAEKELIEIWAKYLVNLSDFFFLESEKTGNKEIYKKIVKRIMFKR